MSKYHFLPRLLRIANVIKVKFLAKFAQEGKREQSTVFSHVCYAGKFELRIILKQGCSG